MGKAWEHLSCQWRLVYPRWMYGGRGPRSNNALDFIIERSNDSQDSWGSQDWQYSTSLVRNSLYCLLHTSWLMGNAPHTSTLRPPDVIHVIGVPRPSSFFAPLPCIVMELYWTKTEERKRGRPGNEARYNLRSFVKENWESCQDLIFVLNIHSLIKFQQFQGTIGVHVFLTKLKMFGG